MTAYDIIIVGAGPAGLTAAVYARRAAKSVLVLEAAACGGQIINTPDIENYPVAPHISGFEFATRLYEQAKALGAEVRFEKVLEIRDGKQVVTAKNTYACRAVILATGSVPRKLGVEGEDDLIGKGISYCATCDGAFYRGKTVAVVGGGNTALEDALYLSALAEKVYLIHRRDTFRADGAAVEKAAARDNIELVPNSTVTALHAAERLQSIEVTDNAGAKQTLSIDGLFVAVGRVPAAAATDLPIRRDEAGYIVAGENCRTDVPGIFVAGDVRTKEVRQLVTAAADGAVAATAAVRYLG